MPNLPRPRSSGQGAAPVELADRADGRPLRAVDRFVRIPYIVVELARDWSGRKWRVYTELVKACDRWQRRVTVAELAATLELDAGNVRRVVAELVAQDVVRQGGGKRRARGGRSYDFFGLDYEDRRKSWDASDSTRPAKLGRVGFDTLGRVESDASLSSQNKSRSKSIHPARDASDPTRPAKRRSGPRGRVGRMEGQLQKMWEGTTGAVYGAERWTLELERLRQHAKDAGLPTPRDRALARYLGEAANDPTIHRSRNVTDGLAVACCYERFEYWWRQRVDELRRARRDAS